MVCDLFWTEIRSRFSLFWIRKGNVSSDIGFRQNSSTVEPRKLPLKTPDNGRLGEEVKYTVILKILIWHHGHGR